MPKRYPQAILASCEVPWDDNYELIEETFREEVRSTIAKGFNHLYIFGTAGEGYAVTLSQFDEIVHIFHEETNIDGVHPMVGVIGMSTPQVVERIGHAYDQGFRVFQISLPPWGEVNDREYITFFTDVCGSFPDAKFVHYNLPRPKRVLLGREDQILENEVPNLVGTKNCRTDIIEIDSIARHSRELQHFYGEHGFPQACIYGECSLLSSWAALFPDQSKEFFNAGVTGQFEKALRMQADFIRVIATMDDLERGAGGPGMDGAYDKMIVRASGADMPLRLLSPYEGFDEETFETWLQEVRNRVPDWFDDGQ
mgnify:CR=1 FL=1